MGRMIDADEYEKRIKPYDTEDDMDKALYNFAHYHLVTTPSAQPEPSQVARDIATIVENEQDMRVVLSQPERKKGKWKRLIVPCNPDKGGFTQTKYECSECGEEAIISWLNMYDLSDFCPHCGADMRGDNNDE